MQVELPLGLGSLVPQVNCQGANRTKLPPTTRTKILIGNPNYRLAPNNP